MTWDALEEVLLDIEIILKKRSLTQIKEECDNPILTSNSLILGRDITFSNTVPHVREGRTMKKRNRYIKRCKETLWKRLRHGYLVALKEKNNLKH